MSTSKNADVKKRREQQRYRTSQQQDAIVGLLLYGLKEHEPIRIIGSHGIGKTQIVLATLKELGFTVVYFSLALMSPQDMAVPVPTLVDRKIRQADGTYRVQEVHELHMLMFDKLANDSKKVIVFDEFSRGDTQTKAAVMQIVNEGSLGNIKIPNLAGVIALDNPEGNYFVDSLDLPQASRFGATIEVTAQDLSWREYLSNKYANDYSEDQLEAIWQTWEGFRDDAVQEIIAPRVVDYMMANALEGIPIEWSLPIMKGRRKIIDRSGVDVTKSVLGSLSAAMGQPGSTVGEYPGVTAIRSALERSDLSNPNRERTNLRIVGHAGTAKTAYTLEAIEEALGKDAYVYMSLALASPEDYGVPVPFTKYHEDGTSEQKLDFLLFEKFNEDKPKVLVLDEFSRGSKRTKQAVMEIIQEGTLNGKEIKGLVCVIALDNPVESDGDQELAGITYDVGEIDEAQATRFAMSVELKPEDLPWVDWLKATYEELADPFIDWWYTGTNTIGRLQVSARILEKMIKLYRNGRDIAEALPVVDGEKIGPDLSALRSMLVGKEHLSFQDIIDRKEEIIAVLDAGDEHPKFPEIWRGVNHAFTESSLTRLREHVKTVVEVSSSMPREFRTGSIRFRGGSNRAEDSQRFWITVWFLVKFVYTLGEDWEEAWPKSSPEASGFNLDGTIAGK